MKIRPKNSILYAYTGVKFSLNNLGGANWRQLVFNNYRLHLLDLLSQAGDADDFGYWLNDMQTRHAKLYNLAQLSGDWESTAYENELVGQYQHDYKGDQRFGAYNPGDSYKTDFNLMGIVKALEQNRYDTSGPRRISGDYGDKDFKVDNLYSAITDDRRLLGRKGDWDESSEEFKQWKSDLNARGWDMYLDTDNYYKLKRLPRNPLDSNLLNLDLQNQSKVPVGHLDLYGFDWNKIGQGLLKIFSNPDLYAFGRLAGNLINNSKVYDEALKGIKPVLRLTYNTHRQVVGDEATKQAYYRRAAQGETKAARPFTSDADRQMAYQFEAKRIGDELRALGDLADNQEIRRTSDESNQHLWANAQRATEVANANIASINQARALRLNLLALKHSALWSSIDNYLKEIEYRKRQLLALQQEYDDLIFALLLLLDLLTNPTILSAKQKYLSVIDKHTKDGITDWNNDEVVNAGIEYKKAQYLVTIDLYRQRLNYYKNRNNSFYFVKSGGKITTTTTREKTQDDLLYKSTRDVVEHFRKMSKISSDAHNRKTPKIKKLTSHPKSTKKYLQGGVAPFTVYTPVSMGGETSTRTSSSAYGDSGGGRSSSSKSGKETSTLDVIKDLFKNLEGLPSDVNGVYASMTNFLKKAKAFGDDIDTDDLANIYLQLMYKINMIKFGMKQWEEASKNANSRDAIQEYAVDDAGRIAALNRETGEITFMEWNKLKDKFKEYNPLTNGDLLNLRAHSPDQAFNYKILEVVNNNGIGMTKIAEFLKSLLPSLGNSELTLDGYTKHEKDLIVQGLELLREAPAGDYKFTKYTKSQQELAKKALIYLLGVLPKNMRAVLQANADMKGIPITELILTLIGSTLDEGSKLEFDAVTGKAAKKEGNGDDIDSDKIKTNPLLAMLRLMGGVPLRYNLVTKDSNTRMSVDGTYYSALPKVEDDTSIDRMLSLSRIDGILDSKYGITFGDLQISPENLKDIMYSNTGGMVATLPCKIVNGHKQVNLAVRELYEKAEQEAFAEVGDRNSPQFEKVLGDKLKEQHLDSLLDSNGRPNKKMFAQFLIVEAYTTDKVKFDTKSQYVEKILNPDENLELRMKRALSISDKKDKKNSYSIDVKNHWFEMFYDDVYRGTVFIPLNNNPNSAMNSWGNSDLKVDLSLDLELLYLLYNKSANYNNDNSFE